MLATQKMKTITLKNGVKFIVNDSIAHLLIKHFDKVSISSNISDTTASDVDKTDYSNTPDLISDFNHLSD